MTQNIQKRGKNYYLRVMIQGKRIYRSLGTGDKREAEKRAGAIIKAAKAERFEALEGSKARSDYSRLGELVEAYEAAAKVRGIRPRTIRDYVSTFYHIVSVGSGLQDPSQASSRILTRELVEVYVLNKLNEANGDTVAVQRARRSVVSSLRQARSLFSKWAMCSYVGLTLPDLGPFLAAGDIKADKVMYRLPPQSLIDKTIHAGKELRETDPELYVVFLLCYGLAMRAGEAAAATWSWLEKGNMEIINRPNFKPKGKDRHVPVSAEVMEALDYVLASREPLKSPFILPGRSESQRTNLIKRKFSAWMRAQGWTSRKYPKAAHELRKLMGSRWYTERGAEVAQAWLGHSDIATTCRFYAALTRIPPPVGL